MKDKATYAGIFDLMYSDIYMITNISVCESDDFTLFSVFRDSQRQRRLRRWRTVLLLRLLLLLVEVAAGSSPPLPAPARTPVWAHCTGWGRLTQHNEILRAKHKKKTSTKIKPKVSWDTLCSASAMKRLEVTVFEAIKRVFQLLQASEHYFTVLLRAGRQ